MSHSAGTIETEFKSLGKKLDTFLAKADKATTEAKGDAHQRVADLKAKREAVRAKLDELREAGDGKWEILKDGIEAAWKDLETTFERMSD